ncbi:MAG: DUF4209 domain-containing protein [Candidatus Cyclonatronum sp.]|uniref:DUF4209 domain-containing protein n=1 Tax=Cyclonatronum sp. TaxID=3024185 RepID=UPI0025BD43DC|nr:DUF4209 domain-containing protein [Cyclonatronum sp.]MCH8486854.1 DUF4209 domain-containing protein [Cyclonatronum sp.]
MPILKLKITVEDLDGFDFKSKLEESPKVTVESYRSVFENIMNEQKDKDDNKASIASLLSAICTFALRPNHSEGPFVPFYSSPEGRSPIPSDLSQNEIEVLAEIENKINDSDFNARISDVIWVASKNHKAAHRAVDHYLSSIQKLEEAGEHIYVPNRALRAVELASLLGGKKTGKTDEILNVICEIVRKRVSNNIVIRTLGLIDILIDRDFGSMLDWAEASKKLAEFLENEKKFDVSRMFWERAAKAFQKHGDSEAATTALISEAESYVKLADSSESEMVKSSFIRSAFEAYRSIPDTDERREELHKQLLLHQEKALQEMGTISTPFDLKDYPEKAKKAVEGKELIESLYSLAFLDHPIKVSELRKGAEKSAELNPLTFMMSSERVNALGRVVGTKPNGFDDYEGAIVSMMHDDATRYHMLATVGLINPARQQVLADHPNIDIRDLEPLFSHNAFIPNNRKLQFAHGLLAGFKGEFIISAHLLIPQIENSLRVILQRMGVITTGLDSSNRRQNEQSLNVTLYDYQPHLEKIFGEDIIFELQNLLVEPLGANLRNEIMHGLVSDGNFYSYPVIYLWWLTLHLCCIANQTPLPEEYIEESNENGDSETESNT